MRPLALTAALLALLLAPAASAKEITAVAACGADDCVTTRDPAVLRLMMDGGTPLAGPNGEPGVVRLRAEVTEPGRVMAVHENPIRRSSTRGDHRSHSGPRGARHRGDPPLQARASESV